MHNLVYFVNFYMFRAYLGPSSGGTTVLFQSIQDNRESSKGIISTSCYIHRVVPPDDKPIYARNMYRLTKNTKLCIKLVFLYTIISICRVNKT